MNKSLLVLQSNYYNLYAHEIDGYIDSWLITTVIILFQTLTPHVHFIIIILDRAIFIKLLHFHNSRMSTATCLLFSPIEVIEPCILLFFRL